AFHQPVPTRDDLRAPLYGTLQSHCRQERARLAHVERRFRPYFRSWHNYLRVLVLINGPLVDKIGGKKGILIAALGAAAANVALGVITWLVLTNRIHVRLLPIFSVTYALNTITPCNSQLVTDN